MSNITLATVLTLLLLSLLPLLFMAATSFVKISVVLSILRNAIGTNQVPSGAVVTALASILTLYVMAPVGMQMMQSAEPKLSAVSWEAPLAGQNGKRFLEAAMTALLPLNRFLEKHSGKREKKLFFDLAKKSAQNGPPIASSEKDLAVVFPAFLITELAEAFLIGFLLFIPFLIIDLVVANIVLSLGMHMLSPTTISLPFKLLLFVAVDGWYLVSEALVSGYL
ncbi:MAG: EscR/YscR/HrcR family type III secretion system export apparatus protein [Myxococcales bacterium]|nr:MAG: EscR/YscR/HrcR family type III secretion system export apparatus protein [Myxococcales bacterium]